MKDRPIHPLVQDTHAFKSDPAIQVRQARFRKRRGFDAGGGISACPGFSASKRFRPCPERSPGAVKEQRQGRLCRRCTAGLRRPGLCSLHDRRKLPP